MNTLFTELIGDHHDLPNLSRNKSVDNSSVNRCDQRRTILLDHGPIRIDYIFEETT